MEFTSQELKDAAHRIGGVDAISAADAIVCHLADDICWDEEEILAAGIAIGWNVTIPKVIAKAKKNREVPVEETLTWKELEEYYRKNTLLDSHHYFETVKRKIISSREPDYPLGTVVKDAGGTWYRRRLDGWVRFQSIALSSFDQPARPLEVKS